jgi:hypothetical protein
MRRTRRKARASEALLEPAKAHRLAILMGCMVKGTWEAHYRRCEDHKPGQENHRFVRSASRLEQIQNSKRVLVLRLTQSEEAIGACLTENQSVELLQNFLCKMSIDDIFDWRSTRQRENKEPM